VEAEKSRIEALGGEVKPGNGGVLRVVWNRVRQPHNGPVLRSTEREQVPFLSVSRSLGDLWSYDFERKDYLVSPVPDLSVRPIDVRRDRFIILGSDGLWGVVSPQDAVKFVHEYKEEEGKSDVCHALIVECLNRWRMKRLRADNISVVILFFHEPTANIESKESVSTEVGFPCKQETGQGGSGDVLLSRKRPAKKMSNDEQQNVESKVAKTDSESTAM
jgi:protein phosphatase 1D